MRYLHTTPTLLDYGYADYLVMNHVHALAYPLLGPGVSLLRALQIAAQQRVEVYEPVGTTISFVDLLKQALAETVDARKQRIFALRYGWSELPPQSFPAISLQIGVSRSRARDIHNHVTLKLWIAGRMQLAGKKPEGACAHLQQLLEDTIHPKEEGAQARAIQFAEAHLPTLPQKRVAQPLIMALLLMPREKNEVSGIH